MKKEEGATVDSSAIFLPYLSSAGRATVVLRAGRAAFFHGSFTLQERPIKYHKCPTFDANRRRFSDFN
jgi:hypothetical protein